MFKRLAVAALTMVLIGAAQSADAQTLTFNDLDCGFGNEVESYQGFSFTNTDCFLGSLDEELGSGFFTAGSGTNVIFGGFGDPFEIFRATPFTVTQFRAAAAWRNNLTLTFEGFLMGSLVTSQTVTLAGPATPQLIELNWGPIDLIRFSTAGGVSAGLEFDGLQVAIDDVVIAAAPSTVVPEPHTAALLATGLMIMGISGGRRRRFV